MKNTVAYPIIYFLIGMVFVPLHMLSNPQSYRCAVEKCFHAESEEYGIYFRVFLLIIAWPLYGVYLAVAYPIFYFLNNYVSIMISLTGLRYNVG